MEVKPFDLLSSQPVAPAKEDGILVSFLIYVSECLGWGGG